MTCRSRCNTAFDHPEPNESENLYFGDFAKPGNVVTWCLDGEAVGS
jgi:hypothetical protein